MTVGEFKRMLETMPLNTPVTFGSSSFSRRPLVFSRTKVRGEQMLCVELTELIMYPKENWHQAEPEHEQRITVAEFLRHIDVGDDWELFFADTIDGAHTILKAVVPAVAIDLVQEGPPVTYPSIAR